MLRCRRRSLAVTETITMEPIQIVVIRLARTSFNRSTDEHPRSKVADLVLFDVFSEPETEW